MNTKVYTLLILVTLVFSLFGCKENKDKSDVKTFKLEHKIIKEDIDDVAPRILLLDSIILMKSSGLKENIISLYSRDTYEKKVSFGARGNAGNEYIFPMTCHGNYEKNHFSIYDVMKNRMYNYKINPSVKDLDLITLDIHSLGGNQQRRSLDEKGPAKAELRSVIRAARYNEDFSVCLTLEDNDKLLALIDSNYNVIEKFGKHPYGELDYLTLSNLFQGKFRIKNDYIVYSPNDIPYLVCYTIENNETKLLWEKEYNPFIYNTNSGKIRLNPTNKGSLTDLDLGDKYIYLFINNIEIAKYDFLKPTMSDANKLLIFSYEGSLVADIELDTYVYSVAVCEEDLTIYAVSRVHTTNYMKFDLPKELFE